MEMLKEVSAALQAQKIIPLPRKYTTPERRDIKQGLQRGPVRCVALCAMPNLHTYNDFLETRKVLSCKTAAQGVGCGGQDTASWRVPTVVNVYASRVPLDHSPQPLGQGHT